MPRFHIRGHGSMADTPVSPYEHLPAIDRETKAVHVIIETPKDCRNKYKFDPKMQLFRLSAVLPAGHSFPYDFGYIPGTKGEDGDPIDILLLMDEPVFAGCCVQARLVGVIEAKQKEAGKTGRNDRLIGVATEGQLFRTLHSLNDLGKELIGQIEHFFISYTQLQGKVFTPLGRCGPKRAASLLRQAIRRYEEERPQAG